MLATVAISGHHVPITVTMVTLLQMQRERKSAPVIHVTTLMILSVTQNVPDKAVVIMEPVTVELLVGVGSIARSPDAQEQRAQQVWVAVTMAHVWIILVKLGLASVMLSGLETAVILLFV